VTSNLQTKAVLSLKDHPIRLFFDEGVVVVPCTDNTVISGVTLSGIFIEISSDSKSNSKGEYKLIHDNFNFDHEEITQLIANGFSSAFIGCSLKNRLKIEALQKCVHLFEQNGFDVSVFNKPQWQKQGVEVSGASASTTHAYWGGHLNPPITLDVLSGTLCNFEWPNDELELGLPKADLNCRFEGSVSLPTIWNELQQVPAKEEIFAKLNIRECNSLEVWEISSSFLIIFSNSER
jgi:hypothetical protein